MCIFDGLIRNCMHRAISRSTSTTSTLYAIGARLPLYVRKSPTRPFAAAQLTDSNLGMCENMQIIHRNEQYTTENH